MKKIVKGNDFTLRIPVMKMVEGEAQAFPLPACTDVVVQVCNQFKRIPLAFEIDVKEDNVLLAKVEGDQMSIGTYAIEVKGKIFGNDWRSNEYPQFAIVANNADADTEFIETDEGDNSVEMDTAMVILPPTVELSDLIDKANKAIKTSEATNTTLNENEDARKEAEAGRVAAEQEREKDEQTRVTAEYERIKAENNRTYAEANRVRTEQAREEIEFARQKSELTRKDNETKRVAAEQERAKVEEARVGAENSRSNAETERVDAETQRASAESERMNAENSRSSAEAERVKAEKKRQTDTDTAIQDLNTHRTEFDDAEAARAKAENARVEAEKTRQQAETDRASAESERVDAENNRVSSETKRKSDFDTAIKAAETATAGAEKVDATLTEENVFEVTGRTGAKKTLDMSGLVSAQTDVARIQESMGAYSDRPDITLVAKETNKAISADGVKVAKTGWAIAEFIAEKGNIYLFKPNEVDGDVCIFAEEITNIETRGIDYTYTYNTDGTIATAKATYLGVTHTYTFSYAEDKSYTITDETGEKVEALPMTYETKVGSYSPLVRLNADAELPIDGYCRYMSHFKGNSSIKIVVSYKIDAADLVMKVVRDGVFASISTQLGNLSQKEDETRKKIEEIHGSYVDVLFHAQATIKVDNSSIKVEPYRIYRLYPKKYLNFSQGWNTYCPLVWIDMTHWDSSQVEDASLMFNCTTSLNEIDFTGTNFSKVKNFSNMFRNSAIKRIKGLESLRTDSAVYLDNSTADTYNGMFAQCHNLTDDSFGSLAAWGTSKMKSISLFKSCESINEVHGIDSWDISSVTSLAGFFSSCKLKISPNLSKWNTKNVTNLDAFLYNNLLTDIDLSSWNTENVTSLKRFLAASPYLKNVNLLGWNLCKVKSIDLFGYNRNIETLKLGEGFFSSPYITEISFNVLEKWTNDSVKLSLVTNLYDRKANGLPDLTLILHANTKKVLSEDDIAVITAKGYIIA